MKDSQKQIIFLAVALGLMGIIVSNAILKTTIRKAEYTIEIYDIFEVHHTENSKGHWTNVYTNGSGQFFFRGDHPINESLAYSFTYVENGKRWRDLTLIAYREIRVLSREG